MLRFAGKETELESQTTWVWILALPPTRAVALEKLPHFIVSKRGITTVAAVPAQSTHTVWVPLPSLLPLCQVILFSTSPVGFGQSSSPLAEKHMRHGICFSTALSDRGMKNWRWQGTDMCCVRVSPRKGTWGMGFQWLRWVGWEGVWWGQSRSSKQGDPTSPAKSLLPLCIDQSWCSQTCLDLNPSRAAFGKCKIPRSHFRILRCYRPQGFLFISFTG